MARGEPLIRQWNLLKAIQAHRFGVAAEELAQRLGCSKRQVQRDLKVLEEVGFPILHEDRDFGKRFWKLVPHALEHEGLMLSITEMVSLFLARQLLAPLSGTPFGDGLATALDKIKALMPKQALGYFGDLDETLLVKGVARHDYSGQEKEIRILNKAITECRVVKLRYHSISKGRDWDAVFHPYGLVYFGTNLYCIGFIVHYNEVRTLKVSRIVGVELTEKRFERPEDFSLEAYLDGSFGIFAPGKLETIEVRFTDWAATSVREHQWHPSQKIVKESSRGCVAQFRLSDTREFKRWILGYGQHAVVISPVTLRKELEAELCAACENYTGKGIQYAAHRTAKGK